jgi:hypothetical protein
VNAVRLASLAMVIGLVPQATAAPDAGSPSTEVVAALTDTMPWIGGRSFMTQPRREASLPILVAAGDAAGGVATTDGGGTFAARARGALRLGGTAGLTVEVRAALLTLDRGEAFVRRLARSEVRLGRGSAGRGAWAGLAIERSLNGNPVPATPLLGLGGSIAPGTVTLGFSFEQTVERARIPIVVYLAPPVDTLKGRFETAFETRLVRATSALVSGRWARGRVGLESVAGFTLTPNVAPSRWMQTSIDVALRPRVALYAMVGDPAPRWLALEPGLARRASVGLKLTSAVNAAAEEGGASPCGPGFRLRRLGQGWYVVEVHAKAGGPVEVMGDFSGWAPSPLRHVTGVRWALAFRMEPGVHQIQARVDGGSWRPPVGLPVASDGFSGDVGVFIAP